MTQDEKIKNNINREIKNLVDHRIRKSFKNSYTYACFPILWGPESDGMGGKTPKDPLQMYLNVATEESCDGEVMYKFNLRRILEEDLEYCGEDGSHAWGFRKIAEEFRKMASRIEDVIAVSENQKS